MEPLFRWIGVLFLLFLVLRVSLARRGKSFGLGAGATLLNLLTGALAGLDVALLAAVRTTSSIDPATATPAGDPFRAAMISILPLAGATFGGLAGYLGLGTLWQRLAESLTAGAIVRLRRIQIGLCLLLLLFCFAIRMTTFNR